MELEAIDFIIKEHYQLLPRLETLALKHVLHSQKLDADEKACAKTKALMLRVGWLSDSEEILLLLRDGVAAFRERLAQRIYDEQGGEDCLITAPAATAWPAPSTRGHDWH